MVVGSTECETGAPRKALTAWLTRRAVVKSGLRSARRIVLSEFSSNPTSRSITAPLAMRPEVGTPWVTRVAAPEATKPPIASWPWATA